MKLLIKGRSLDTSSFEVGLYPESWVLSRPFTHEVTFVGEVLSVNPDKLCCMLSTIEMVISWREE